jgi:phospholipid transport system substrate-binding protein
VASVALFFIPSYGHTKTNADTLSKPGPIIRTYAHETFNLLETYASRSDTKPPQTMKETLSRKLITLVDYRLMTRMALGPAARSMKAEQLKEVRRVFCPLILNMYYQRLVKRLFRENNPWIITGFDVVNSRITGNNNYAIFKTRVNGYKSAQGPENKRSLPLDFKMINRETGWKVYDITIMNVSLVENYRSQFTSILTNGSAEKLVKNLRTKLNNLNAEKLTSPGSCARITRNH